MARTKYSHRLAKLTRRASDQQGTSLVELALTIAALMPGIFAAVALFGAMGVSQADREIDFAATMLVAPSLVQLDELVIKDERGAPELNGSLSGSTQKTLLKNVAKRISRASSTWGTKNQVDFCVHLVKVAPELDASSWTGCIGTIKQNIISATSLTNSSSCMSQALPDACGPLLVSLGCSDQFVVVIHRDLPGSQITVRDCGLGYPTVGPQKLENELSSEIPSPPSEVNDGIEM
mgnify:CR=1 FL=1